MDTFFWSLLLAAISALTFIAYKHPKAFRANIAYPLIILTTLTLFGILAYFFGGAGTIIDNLVTEVSKTPQGDLHMMQFGIERLKNLYEHLVSRISLVSGFLVYLILLVNLPKILMFKPDDN